MAVSYIPAYKGYIADVPQVWFKRCDGRIFHFDEITQASVNPQTNFTEINAGWSLYPVAYLPGQSSMELSMTSGQFNAELFLMANAVEQFQDTNAYEEYVSETITPADEDGTITLTLGGKAKEGSIYIAGLTKTINDTKMDSDGYTVETGTGEQAKTIITLKSGVEVPSDEIEVNYTRLVTAHVIEVNNRSTAVGEAIFKWPVYAAGNDCTESSIKGHVVLHVYRCRVTQMPGFDTGYKNAATNAVTFSAMDPKKDKDQVYSLAYIPTEGNE